MRPGSAWLLLVAVLATWSCRELIGVDEAALDPTLSDASGVAGEGGMGGGV